MNFTSTLPHATFSSEQFVIAPIMKVAVLVSIGILKSNTPGLKIWIIANIIPADHKGKLHISQHGVINSRAFCSGKVLYRAFNFSLSNHLSVIMRVAVGAIAFCGAEALVGAIVMVGGTVAVGVMVAVAAVPHPLSVRPNPPVRSAMIKVTFFVFISSS